MDFTRHPFGLPASHPKADIVNTILKASYENQKESGVTNDCWYVNIVLKQCFDVVEIPVSIKRGILQIGKIQLPYAWLDFQGYVLDNTSVNQAELIFVLMKTNNWKYVEDTSFAKTDHILTGDEAIIRRLGIPDHKKKALQFLSNRLESPLTIAVRNLPYIGIYYVKMRETMEKKFKVTIKNSFVDVNTTCWTCEKKKSTDELKKCSACKVARYCDKACQKKDWRRHKYECLKPISA